MEKEFVTYGLAFKFKELGFDEPCFGWFTEDNHFYLNNIKNGKIFKSNDGCLAPTYQQAFRWVMQFPPLNKWRCNIALYSDGTYSIKDGKDAIYEYLSEESCLEKLIEFIEREK